MAISLVQSIIAKGGSVVLPGNATIGNRLLAIGIDTTAPTQTGSPAWNLIGQYTGSGTLKGSSAWIAVATATASWTPFTSSASVIILMEFASSLGWSSTTLFVDKHEEDHSASSTPPAITTTSFVPTNSDDAVVQIFLDNTTSDTAPSSVAGMTTIATIPPQVGANIQGNGIAVYALNIGTLGFQKTATWSGSTASGAIAFSVAFFEALQGKLTKTTGAATLSATADVPLHGALTKTTGAATLSATGVHVLHGALTKTTGAATLSATGVHPGIQATQVVNEAVVTLPKAPVRIEQVIVEAVRSFQTVPIKVDQVVVEAISPRVVQGVGVSTSGPGGNPLGLIGTYSVPSKYRILVYDTSDNLVTIFTNVRAFDFIDSVNGGSAAGWFRISVDTTTLLTEDTSGATKADQYRKTYLGSLNAVTVAVATGVVGSEQYYDMTFSGNTGQQIVTLTLDEYYRVAIPIYGNSNTAAEFAALIATAIGNYVDQLPGNQYTVQYTGGSATVRVIGASADTYEVVTGALPENSFAATFTHSGQLYAYVGVQGATSYILPANLAAAYQQAFQYNYRVQFYLEDDVNPWYDGRINGWTPEIPDTSTDDAYITVYTEGFQNALNDGIVTETLNPGEQPNGVNNGTITADKYLAHLINTYQDNKLFGKPYIAAVPVDLFQMQFQGEGLAGCINDVITQVISDSGHTFEWWVRGLHTVGYGKSLAVVVQPNADPKLTNPYMRIAPTANPIARYFVYEVRGQTIYDYTVQNTIINLYNMIALYGGRDPTSQLQVYGAFEDSISIALYGLRQQRVTNDNLLAKEALDNYAIAYLLLNAYPQPQTTYYKYTPSSHMRAGVWVQVLEPGDGTVIAQTLHQMRAIQVECQLQEDQEKMDQIVTAAAPQPFIDRAYYGAIQQNLNTIPVIIDRGGTINPNTYMVSGGDWVTAHQNYPPIPVISPPLGHFGKAKQNQDGNPPGPGELPLDISLSQAKSDPHYPNFGVPLVDTNNGKHGDGAYELDFVTNMQEFAPEQPTGPGILVTALSGQQSIGNGLGSGNLQETPSSPDALRMWQFIVIDGAIAGAVDMRTYYGQYAGAPEEAQSIMLTVPAGPKGGNNLHFFAPAEPKNGDWFGSLQMGYTGAEVLLWFCQKGAPWLNANPTPSFTPVIYNGDISWFGSISGTVSQIQEPDWASQYCWGPQAPNHSMTSFTRAISFITQPKWEQIGAVPAGTMGSGNGNLRNQCNPTDPNHGGPFMNYDFPGGLCTKITLYFPNLELPLLNNGAAPTYLYYEAALQVNCTNGNVLQTKRQFVITNNGQALR